MPKSESTHISKKEFKLFCLGLLFSLALWALEKTRLSVSICVGLMALTVIPMVKYSEWIEKKKISKALAFVLWYAVLGVFGWSVWPKEHLHGSIARRVDSLLVEPLFPYHTGKAKLNIFYKNVGTAQIRNRRFDGKLEIVPVSMNEDELFTEFKNKASFSPGENDLPPNSPELFKTIYSRDLTEQDVSLLSGPVPVMKMCAVSAILWEDDTGQYESDLCGCMEPQRHAGAIPPFGFTRGHNGEWRTR
jgi:hypothetical protein